MEIISAILSNHLTNGYCSTFDMPACSEHLFIAEVVSQLIKN